MNRESPTAHVSTVDAFNTIVDSLNDPYFEADSAGIITFVNRAYHENLGYRHKKDVIGRSFVRFTAPSTVRLVFERFSELYRTGEPLEPFDYYCRRQDGGTIAGEIVASPILANGVVVGTRGIIRDISRRVAAHEALRKAKEVAEARARELAAVNRVATALSRSLKLTEILQMVCREVTAIFPVRNAGVALLTPDRSTLKVVAFHTDDPDEPSAMGLELAYRGNKSSEHVIETQRTLVIQDAQQDARTEAIAEITRMRGTQALMIVPIVSRAEAIGTLGLPARDPSYVFTENDISLAETIASQIASAVDNAQLHARTESALGAVERDMEIGREIQAGFFPDTVPQLPGWEIAAQFHAARQVAGDFYDLYPIRGSNLIAFVVADVCDKGVGAALFMVLVRSLLRAFSEQPVSSACLEEGLLRIVLSTNNYIARYHGRSNMFATLVFGVLDPETGCVHYVNAGHEPPIVLDRDGGVIRRLMPTGPAVGLFVDMPFHVEQVHLGPGECLVSFTDGITDAQNEQGKQFTEERLIETIAYRWTSVFSMLFELDLALRRHAGEESQFDDITVVAFRRKLVAGTSTHAICREARLEVLPEIREFVEAASREEGLGPEDSFAFKLCADELCTNIIQHGYTGRQPGLFSLAFDTDECGARITITDDGTHFPPESAPTPDLDATVEDRPVGGMGIHFVRELMDEISYTRIEGGNRLVIRKNFEQYRRNRGIS